MSDYFYPEYELVIGGNVINEGIQLESQQDKFVTFDWLIITWTEKLMDAISVCIGDDVSLSVGYSGSLTQIFSGYVTSTENLQITVKNEMLKMYETKIINAFKQCVPQDVLTFILDKAGIADFTLNGENEVIKKLYNVSNLTAMQVLKDVDLFFKLEPSTSIFTNKKFEWNKEPIHSGYSFQYGENIISLVCLKEKHWEVETVLIPGMEVLKKIDITHPRVNGTFTVYRLRYFIDMNGFIRLKMQFEED